MAADKSAVVKKNATLAVMISSIRSARCFLSVLFLLICFFVQACMANVAARTDGMIGVEVDPARTASQQILPENTAHSLCTETAFLNALRFGLPEFQKILEGLPCKTDQERLAYIAKTFGGTASVVDPKQKCSDGHGVMADNYPVYFNAIIGPKASLRLVGTYFAKGEKEAPELHLQRIHKLLLHSLQNGVPIVTSIRSFGAEQHGDKYYWEGISGHTILVIAVSKKLPSFAEGFAFQFIDSWSGRLCEGYVYCEKMRGFAAIKGAGEKDFQWLDRGFLLITAPSLNLETNKEPWYARTFMMLNYGLGAFDE